MMVPLLLAAVASACSLPGGWDGLDHKRVRYLVFGEVHGTRESPAAVGEIACALAKRGERLLVAIELNDTDNAGLQRAWAGPHAAFRPAALAGMPSWRGTQDGVRSVAMLDLLDRLHALKNAGRPIAVVAFNGSAKQGEKFAALKPFGDHEAAQAENIRMAADAGRYDRVIVLVGNYHARKTPIQRGPSISYRPMAMHLASASEVLSIYMVAGPGTMFNCFMKAGASVEPGKPIPTGALDCSAHTTKGMAPIEGPPRVEPSRSSLDWLPSGYDAWYWLGPSTASPPAQP